MNRVKNLLMFIIPAGVISILLYDSLLAVLPLFILYPGFIKLIKKSEYKKRDYKISKEFIVFLTSMSGALNAGYALENTLEIIRDDLIKEFSVDSILANECDRAINMISLKMSFNNVIYDMAKELSNKDIDTFAEVLSISKNVGGDLIEMIDLTINQVKDRIETNEDIAVLVSAKKLEKNIMLMVPFFMITFLRMSNPGYLDPLYKNAFGIIVMSVCLVVIIICYIISEKIVDIKV